MTIKKRNTGNEQNKDEVQTIVLGIAIMTRIRGMKK